jgi:hypothetical protein
MNFLKDNYLRTSGSGATFHVEIDSPTDKNANFHTTCIDVAEQVYQSREGKLYLMYSGGVDSEYILNLFLSLGIDIIPVIIRLTPFYNDHDVKYAFDFCESKNLKPIVVDLNFDDFVKSGRIVDIATEFKIGAYQLPSTFSCLDQLDGTVVMGSHGPPHMILDQKNNTWMVDEIEPLHTVLQYFKKNKIVGCPYFLVHTPEQYLSFLQHPIMQDLANHKFLGKLGNNSTKGLVYNDVSGFDLVARQKYTGYENIENSEIFNHPNLKIFEEFKNQWWGTYQEPYHNLISRLQNLT